MSQASPSSNSRDIQAPTSASGRCIVLADAAAGVAPPPALLAGLAQRGLVAVVVGDPQSVLAQLDSQGAAAVILAQTAASPSIDQMLVAVRHDYPRTGCWRFVAGDDGEGPRLAKCGAYEESGGAPDDEAPRPLRYPALAHESEGQADDQPLVSREEISMLLDLNVEGPLPSLAEAWLADPQTSSSIPDDEAGPFTYAPRAAEAVDPIDLGDVDLIESVFAGSGLREMAMRVVTARCGIPRVSWAAPGEPVPDDHVAHRIAYRGRDLGLLHAPSPAPPVDLAGWAGWLARWVGLDEQMRMLRDMSMRDALTGAWNRRYFDRFLDRILQWARGERSQVTLMVFDIDDFKKYNDTFGHAAGDDILRECSRLMRSVVREHDVVARIGGDEFAVIFWDADAPRRAHSEHPEDVLSAARRFQQAIYEHDFPKLLDQAPGTLTISGGLASYPWDGRTPDELLNKADEMALESKRQGKNAIRFGPGAQRLCRQTQA